MLLLGLVVILKMPMNHKLSDCKAKRKRPVDEANDCDSIPSTSKRTKFNQKDLTHIDLVPREKELLDLLCEIKMTEDSLEKLKVYDDLLSQEKMVETWSEEMNFIREQADQDFNDLLEYVESDDIGRLLEYIN